MKLKFSIPIAIGIKSQCRLQLGSILLFSFFVFLFVFNCSNSFAQDRISTKAGTNLAVKIIHVDSENVFFHQTIDSTKTIRKVSRKSISNYEYNSIENGSNKKVISEDSILFVNYLRDVEGIYYTNNKEIINFNEQKKIAKRDSLALVKLAKTPNAKTRFTNAGNYLIIASACIIVGSAINIYAEDIELKNNPTNMDIKNYNELQQFLHINANLFYGISGLFILGAGINLHSGAMQLKP